MVGSLGFTIEFGSALVLAGGLWRSYPVLAAVGRLALR
jgi:hypothetical protein